MHTEQPASKFRDMCKAMGQQGSIFIDLYMVIDNQLLIISFFTDKHFSIGADMLFKETLNVFWR